MHTILYYLIIGLLDTLRIFVIYKYLLQLKLKLNRGTVLFLLGIAVSVYFVLYYFNLHRAYKAAELLLVFIGAVTMLDCRRIRCLLAASFLITVRNFDQILLSVFLICAPQEAAALIYSSQADHLLAAAASACLLYGAGRIIYSKSQKADQSVDLKYSILLTIIAAMNAIVQFAMLRLLLQLTNRQLSGELLIYVSILEGISLSEVVVLTIFAVTKEHYKRSDELSQYQLNVKTAYYEEILAKEQSTRKFRHDIKNLLLSIQVYNREGEPAEVEACVKEILQTPALLPASYQCGDELLNAILADKNAWAKHVNATILCVGHLPKHRIGKTDLCIIFGNLLDNAIEACEKTSYCHELKQDSPIQVTLHTYQQDLLIKIENPMIAANYPEGLRTTKAEKEYHGFGLQNIKDCIEKYQGSLKITAENHTFTVMLVLRNVLLC